MCLGSSFGAESARRTCKFASFRVFQRGGCARVTLTALITSRMRHECGCGDRRKELAGRDRSAGNRFLLLLRAAIKLFRFLLLIKLIQLSVSFFVRGVGSVQLNLMAERLSKKQSQAPVRLTLGCQW